jgi:AcrR family transcriptional regulator
VRLQVARACLELLAEGRTDFGPAEVAQRAGVSRATLHRWWPRHVDLLREALTLHTASLEPPDTGTWAGDLRLLVRQLARFFAEPVEVSQNAIMASGRHPEYEAVVLEHYEPLQASWRAVVTRAQARGEVRADVDPATVVLLVASPLLVLPTVLRRTPTARQLARIVDLVLAATEVPRPPPGPKSARRVAH